MEHTGRRTNGFTAGGYVGEYNTTRFAKQGDLGSKVLNRAANPRGPLGTPLADPIGNPLLSR